METGEPNNYIKILEYLSKFIGDGKYYQVTSVVPSLLPSERRAIIEHLISEGLVNKKSRTGAYRQQPRRFIATSFDHLQDNINELRNQPREFIEYELMITLKGVSFLQSPSANSVNIENYVNSIVNKGDNITQSGTFDASKKHEKSLPKDEAIKVVAKLSIETVQWKVSRDDLFFEHILALRIDLQNNTNDELSINEVWFNYDLPTDRMFGILGKLDLGRKYPIVVQVGETKSLYFDLLYNIVTDCQVLSEDVCLYGIVNLTSKLRIETNKIRAKDIVELYKLFEKTAIVNQKPHYKNWIHKILKNQ